MAKMIPEELKRDVPLVMVAQSQGCVQTRQGKAFVILSRFTQEKTPFCVSSLAKNLYQCFGCNAGVSVVDWLQHTDRLTYPQTLVWLCELAGPSSLRAAL